MPDPVSIQQRIKRHEQQAARLRAQLTQQARKLDTRRKILTGAVVLAEIEANDALRHMVCALLDRRLKRDDDRAALQDYLPSAEHGALRA